jgi:NAD(P)-dependent dehydrogenase (short-subunit alcohol dehydrogenase family)
MELTNKRIIIIGGTQGIGLATARLAMDKQASVLIAGRKIEKAAKAKTLLGDVQTAILDAADEEQVKKFFTETSSFDHLVITAAGAAAGSLREISIDKAKDFFNSKLWLQTQVVKYALEKISQQGSIVLFSGIVSRKAMPGQLPFTGVAGAIESIGRMLAKELAPIRVNVVTPGVINTPAWNEILPENDIRQYFQDLAGRLPIPRIGRAEDVAKGVIFLLENTYCTGTVLDIDGGLKEL